MNTINRCSRTHDRSTGCPEIWLISTYLQDPDQKDLDHDRATHTPYIRHYIPRKAVLPFVVAVLAVTPFSVAHAGIFAFVAEFFGRNTILFEKERKNSQSMNLLQAALNHNPNPSKGGGDIVVVEGQALLSEAGPLDSIDTSSRRAPSHSGEISIYVVREGDSLSQIAEMFGVSTNTILWANDIQRGDLVRVGQTLVILPISGVRHVVGKDDTLASIVKKYEGNLEDVLEYNGLSENVRLAVGDVVVIPDGRIPAVAAPTGASRVAEQNTSTAPSYAGYYVRPLTGGVRTQGIHGYNAVDIAAPTGTPIYAAASGTVLISRNSGWNGGYGSYIVIRHPNNTQTLYAHLSETYVSAGATVSQGQTIGAVGNTGRSTGPHLHFEVRGARNPF